MKILKKYFCVNNVKINTTELTTFEPSEIEHTYEEM